MNDDQINRIIKKFDHPNRNWNHFSSNKDNFITKSDKDKINIMPKHQSDDSDYDSQQDGDKFVYKKPQVWRLDKFKNLKKIVINLSTTQYPVLTDVAQDLGWKVQYNMEAGDWDVYWTDIPIDTDTLIKMHLFQKVNYYPGIHTLARKNLLGMNLMNMKQRFPNDYNFFPLTWMLPAQYAEFRQYYETKKQGKTRTYIVKPQAECQGRGIFLTRNIQDLQNGKHYVVQRYIAKPYLMEGLKFDLRIYVLLCGTNPLRLYIYEDGLARFATEKYVEPTNENLEHQYMHLTNYAINKRSPKFVFNNSSTNMGIGHKRSLKCIYEQMRKKGLDVDKLKLKINDLIIKTIIAGLPLMSHQYKCCQPEDYSNSMCFHVIGFDVMLDHKEEPQLIEINHTPSFATDTPLDYKIKFGLIKDTLKLMHITSKRKKVLFQMAKQSNQARLHNKKRQILDGAERQAKIAEEQKSRDDFQNRHLGGFTKIYPLSENEEQKTKYYEQLMEGAYKMHYAQNTPIRIKLEQAEKKKQAEQDMSRIKDIQKSKKNKQQKLEKKVQKQSQLINSSFIKMSQSKQQQQSQQGQTNLKVKKSYSMRESANLKEIKQKNQSFKEDELQNQQSIFYSQNNKKRPNTHSNDSEENQNPLYKSQLFIDITDSTPIHVVSSSQINTSNSQSTANTRKQLEKDQKQSLHKSYLGKTDHAEKLTQKTLDPLKGTSKMLTSIERELMRKQSFEIHKSNAKLGNSTDQFLLPNKDKIIFSEMPLSCKQILCELFTKSKPLPSSQKNRQNSRQGQLPNIHDPNSQQQTQEVKKSDSFKLRSNSKNQKPINIMTDDLKHIMQTKSKRHNIISLERKINDPPQMTRLMARKVNFSHFKGNYNNPNLTNMIPTAIGPGGFVVPKMYHLNVESQKRIEASQNILAMISRKNVNNNIFPL